MRAGSRLAIIGIDGGSWNILKWLIRDGFMANLERLISDGTHGSLRSVIPPITGGAWLSIATGLNPGKTGVIDFLKHVGDFILEPVSSADFQGRSLWDYFSALGYRVAVLDYPMLYPAYPVNGVMLCSWGPSVSVFPRPLTDLLKSMVKEYEIFVKYHLEKYNDVELFLRDLDRAVEKKLRISRHLSKKEWDLFIDVFSFTDWLQHRIWHYIDPSHPMYPGDVEASKYKRKFAEYWQTLDEYIGEISETYDNILVISDHGFGPQWGVFNLAKWVLKHGFSVPRRGLGREIRGVTGEFLGVLRKAGLTKITPGKLRRRARKLKLTTTSLLQHFDAGNSKFIILEYTIPFGGIHLNPKLKGTMKERDIVEKFMNLIGMLGDEIGKELKASVWRSREIYWGDKVDLLPDLILMVNDWSCVIVKDPKENFIYIDRPYSPRHTGSHRLYGIFIAKGEDFKEGLRLDQVSVLDIAPTALYMFKAPIPSEMDGKVLRGILIYGDAREPEYVPSLYYRAKHMKRVFKE